MNQTVRRMVVGAVAIGVLAVLCGAVSRTGGGAPGLRGNRLAAEHVLALQETAAAVPPVELNPCWSAVGWSAYPLFGTSVSTAGDVNGDGLSDIVVGEPFDDRNAYFGGDVHVYLSAASGIETESSFNVVTYQLNARFGYSVASAGDLDGDGYDDVIVGAPLWDRDRIDEGIAVVYYGSAAGLEPLHADTLSVGQRQAQFGHVVSSAGDVDGDGFRDVVVGAPLYDAGAVNEGAIFVFRGGPGGVVEEPAWMAASGVAGANSGWSVASGDMNGDGYGDVVAGAPGYGSEGAALAYFGSPDGLSSEAAWIVEGEVADSGFGRAVASAGDANGDGYDDVLVSAPETDTDGIFRGDGLVYVFLGSEQGPGNVPEVVLSFGSGVSFGCSVASAGDLNADGFADVIVGTRHGYSEVPKVGAIVYLGGPTGLRATPDQSLIVSTADPGHMYELDIVVASAGDVNADGSSDIVLGDRTSNWFIGRALVHLGNRGYGKLRELPVWSSVGGEPYGAFGAAVAGIGDVNGDGRLDLAVGAPRQDGLHEDAGAVYVYYGDGNGHAAASGWHASGTQAGAGLGYSVSGAGDFDGDGYEDLAVGAPHQSALEGDEGAVFLFPGGAKGMDEPWSIEGEAPGAQLGFSVGRAGDVDGDGLSDIVVGAFRFSGGFEEEGRVDVHYGTPYGPMDSRGWTAIGGQAGAWFGYAVASAGDVNGDTYSDVIVGAPYRDNGETDEGGVFVYLGSDTGLADTPAAVLEIDVPGALFGVDVAPAGDVNGDGYGDIVVGTIGDAFLVGDVGFAFLFRGGPDGIVSEPVWSATGGGAQGSLGQSVAGVGDVNGDGFADIVIGDPCFDGETSDVGRMLLFTGRVGGLLAVPDWEFVGSSAGGRLGCAIAAVGDVDGDGYSDVAAGANGTSEGGEALVFGTNAHRVPLVLPGQFRTDSTLIGPLGFSGDPDRFDLRARVRVPPGVGGVALQWQTAQERLPYEGQPIGEGARYDVRQQHREQSGPTVAAVAGRVSQPGYQGPVCWRMRIVYEDGKHPYSRWFYHPANETGESPLRLASAPEAPPPPPPPPVPEPEEYSLVLRGAFPNPFNPVTFVRFELPHAGSVILTVYDVAGRPVRTLYRGSLGGGAQAVAWDGSNDGGEPVPSGVYLVRLAYGGENLVKKLVLVR